MIILFGFKTVYSQSVTRNLNLRDFVIDKKNNSCDIIKKYFLCENLLTK